MITASYAGRILARARDTIFLEGNHYFPRETVDKAVLEKSWLRTLCYWKGVASYYHIRVAGKRLPNAAWSYNRPSPLARRIRTRIAFDPSSGILVRDDGP